MRGKVSIVATTAANITLMYTIDLPKKTDPIAMLGFGTKTC